MVTNHRINDREMQRCLVDCYHAEYPLARLQVFLQTLRDRGVSAEETHQVERAMLRLLTSLRMGGWQAANVQR